MECSTTRNRYSVHRSRAIKIPPINPYIRTWRFISCRRIRYRNYRTHSLTLKPHAQPGPCLYHNHHQQISRTTPARPLGKPLPTLNPTSLATQPEQLRSHPQRRHRDRKRIADFRPNPCLEPSTLDRTRHSSALRSTV